MAPVLPAFKFSLQQSFFSVSTVFFYLPSSCSHADLSVMLQGESGQTFLTLVTSSLLHRTAATQASAQAVDKPSFPCSTTHCYSTWISGAHSMLQCSYHCSFRSSSTQSAAASRWVSRILSLSDAVISRGLSDFTAILVEGSCGVCSRCPYGAWERLQHQICHWCCL